MDNILIGIDPGSRITGYGVVRFNNNRLTYIDSGCIRITGENWAEKLQQVFAGVSEVVNLYRPQSAAIEQVFMHQNPGAALKLGQARGAAIVAMTQQGLTVAEYSARQIKQSVVGYGAADKAQVQMMVCQLLGLSKSPQADAADALATAICHAHSSQSIMMLQRRLK